MRQRLRAACPRNISSRRHWYNGPFRVSAFCSKKILCVSSLRFEDNLHGKGLLFPLIRLIGDIAGEEKDFSIRLEATLKRLQETLRREARVTVDHENVSLILAQKEFFERYAIKKVANKRILNTASGVFQ